MSHLDSCVLLVFREKWRGEGHGLTVGGSTCFHGGTSQQCSVGLLQSEDELVKPTLKRNRLLLGSRDGNPDTPNLDENILPNIKYLQVSPLTKKNIAQKKIRDNFSTTETVYHHHRFLRAFSQAKPTSSTSTSTSTSTSSMSPLSTVS